MSDVKLDCFDALLRAAIVVRRHIEVVSASLDLTPPQARMLLLLDEPMRMSAVATATGCEPSHATGLADQLEELGLARREVDPDDRRVRQISLTPAGVRLRERLEEALIADAPIVGRLSDGDAVRLMSLLEE